MNRLSRRLLAWYAQSGRAHLPWRMTRDPYCILVSEVMLQQTQVERVIPKYEAFIARFPDFGALAAASTADVLREWKGLGYNSRALRLKQTAQAVLERFGGAMPRTDEEMRALPGLGPYTRAALRAFAFELDDAALDTNLRRVAHRVLYGLEYPPALNRTALDEQTRHLLPPGRAHDWNSAMMDLGATICTARAPKCLLCPLQKLCAAAPIDAAALERARVRHARTRSPQEAIPFERSRRYARGRIIDRLRDLPEGARISLLDLHADLQAHLHRSPQEVTAIVRDLSLEGLVLVENGAARLPE